MIMSSSARISRKFFKTQTVSLNTMLYHLAPLSAASSQPTMAPQLPMVRQYLAKYSEA